MTRGPGPDGDPLDVLLVEDNPGDVRLTEEGVEAAAVAESLHVGPTERTRSSSCSGAAGTTRRRRRTPISSSWT